MRVRNETLIFESPKFGIYLLLHTDFLHLTRYKQYQPKLKTIRSLPMLPELKTTTTDVNNSKFSFKQKKYTYVIMHHEHSRTNIGAPSRLIHNWFTFGKTDYKINIF